MSPRRLYEEELKQLQESIEEMGMGVRATYARLFSALQQQKESVIEEIIASDQSTHTLQRRIEGSCLNLITKQQPIARDLRQVSASLKVVTDISRIGDQCSDIAELVKRMHFKDLQEFSAHIPQMIEETGKQLTEAINAFVDRNAESAQHVVAGDDTVDDLFNQVKNDVIAHLRSEAKDSDDCIDVMMFAKYLEKIGDHAVNIANWAIFQETGEVDHIRLL